MGNVCFLYTQLCVIPILEPLDGKINKSYWFGRPFIAIWIARKRRFFQWTYVYTPFFYCVVMTIVFCPISFMTINLRYWPTPNQTYVQFIICDMASSYIFMYCFTKLFFIILAEEWIKDPKLPNIAKNLCNDNIDYMHINNISFRI